VGAAVVGLYATLTLASDWLVLKRLWRDQTRATDYDPERDVFV
jgi:hypothetical protein